MRFVIFISIAYIFFVVVHARPNKPGPLVPQTDPPNKKSQNINDVASLSNRLLTIMNAMLPGAQIFTDDSFPTKVAPNTDTVFNIFAVKGLSINMFRIQGFFDSDEQLRITGIQAIEKVSDFGILPFPEERK